MQKIFYCSYSTFPGHTNQISIAADKLDMNFSLIAENKVNINENVTLYSYNWTISYPSIIVNMML